MEHRVGLATRTQLSVCKSPFPSAGTAVSLLHAKTDQQRPLANSMSLSQSYVSHCRVLPQGELNGISSQSHVSHCKVGLLLLGEFTVVIPEPDATLQGVTIAFENRFSPYFTFFVFLMQFGL